MELGTNLKETWEDVANKVGKEQTPTSTKLSGFGRHRLARLYPNKYNVRRFSLALLSYLGSYLQKNRKMEK